MFEAFECFVCRQVMALLGADASRCPGCGSVHGAKIRRAHVNKPKSQRAVRRRPARRKKTN
jgi:hypothetical protein